MSKVTKTILKFFSHFVVGPVSMGVAWHIGWEGVVIGFIVLQLASLMLYANPDLIK